MSGNILSPLCIQKLGHSIEEIRSRALHSIWSKYDMNLIDDLNWENTKSLLENLLNWFNFDRHPHEDIVLELIIKILKINCDLHTTEINCKDILLKVNKIKKCVDARYLPLIQEIYNSLERIGKDSLKYEPSAVDKICFHEDSAQKDLLHCPSETNSFDVTEKNQGCENDIVKNKAIECYQNRLNSNCSVKIEHFPWQNLIDSDSCALTSIYDGLRYIENTDSILRSCQIFVDVLLKDFPTEVFLQRTLLIQSFLELLKFEEICGPAINCLLTTIKHLHNQYELTLDMFLVHSTDLYKNYNVFDMLNNEDNNCFRSEINRSNNGQYLFDGDLDIYQLSFTEFCFQILHKAIQQLSVNKPLNEHNQLLELILYTFNLLKKNISPMLWCPKHTMIDKLNKTFGLFHESLKYFENKCKITHITIVYIIVKIVNTLGGSDEELEQILPHHVQLELIECLSDYALILLFPALKSDILSVVEKFQGQRKKEVLENCVVLSKLFSSMKSAVEFMKLETKSNGLYHAHKGLPCLDFHRNMQFIEKFVRKFLLKPNSQFEPDEVVLRKKILLQLLAHEDEEVKGHIYQELHSFVIKNLGVEVSEKRGHPHPGNMFEFLFDSDVLTEMICYGLNSKLTKVQDATNEIFVHLLKGKIFFSNCHWQNFIKSLRPCLPLLECFSDKSTALGRCITKMLDPDISSTIQLSNIDILRGNLRLLFSKCHLIREEALLRLFWLMKIDDPDNKLLPRQSKLTGLNLSSVCSSVVPENYCGMRQSFYSTDGLCSVMEMLFAENVEPSVRRSVLSQLSVMLEDQHLHSKFYELDGLKIILDIFRNCLIEKEYQNYPDSVVPIMKILKLLCLHNSAVRLQLSMDADLYHCILRGLLLFNSERHSRQQGVELLCLLLYNECIINTQSNGGITSNICMPEVVVNRMCLPFFTVVHWKYSKNTEPSVRESVMLNKKMSRVLRIYWNIQWFGSISKVLSLRSNDMKKNIISNSLPKDMHLRAEDLKSLQECSIIFGIQKTLFNIQNATTHETVMHSLHKLHSYLLLYELEEDSNKRRRTTDFEEVEAFVDKMQWESTFRKFLLSKPSSEDDEILLLQIVRCIRLFLNIFRSERLFIWAQNLLTDELETFPCVLKSYVNQDSSLVRRDLIRAIIGLAKDIVTKSTTIKIKDWLFYLNTIGQQFKHDLGRNQDKHDIAYIGWLTSFLVDITGRLALNTSDRFEFSEEVITRIMEIMAVVYCIRDSQKSFIGTNVIKNCLFILNHLLVVTQGTIEKWEQFWYKALTKVTHHKELPNYIWLMSLWFVRDAIIRALSVQLLVGFTTTCSACEILIEQLHINFEHLWLEGFPILLNNQECSLVREKMALLLSNLICHGSVSTDAGFLQNLKEMKFYETVFELMGRIQMEPKLLERHDCHIPQRYPEHGEGDNADTIAVSSASLIAAVNTFIFNLIFIKPEEVTETLVEAGLLECLTRLFDYAPETCEKYKNEKNILDILKMYETGCKVILKCIISKPQAFVLVQQSQLFINSLYGLMNFTLFDGNSENVMTQRNKLWSELLSILSVILTGADETSTDIGTIQVDGFKSVHQAMSENGTDHFISSIYLCASSNSTDLRSRCLQFLANLFTIEASRTVSCSVSQFFDKNIHLEASNQASKRSWKGFANEMGSDLNFVNRLSDVFLQMYSLSGQSEDTFLNTVIIDALAGLLLVWQKAQFFCVDRGLADDILAGLNTVFMQLSVENVDCLKKVSERKRIDPFLQQIERYCLVLNNLLMANKKIKNYVSSIGLACVLHKLWHWCIEKTSLLTTALKLLCTFSHISESACQSMATDKSWNSFGVRKQPGSATLLAAIMMHIDRVMLSAKSNYIEVLQLSFQILENCCRVAECRSLMVKGPLLACFANYCQGLLTKKRILSTGYGEMWYDFFIAFTCHEDGQLALTKNQDALEAILHVASSNCHHRTKALRILQNISFHPLNRVQLLNNYKFLSLMMDIMKSGSVEEVCMVLNAVWGLTCNWQKGKIVIRNAGFENILKQTKKKIMLSGNPPALSLIDNVIQILQNK